MKKFKEGDILYIKSNETLLSYIAPFYRTIQSVVGGHNVIATHGYLDEHNNIGKEDVVLIAESRCKEIRLATINERMRFRKQLESYNLSFNGITFKYENLTIFKKGDFVSTETGAWTFIVKEPLDYGHANIYIGKCFKGLVYANEGWFSRLATPKEKEDLLNLLAKEGLSWDEENLELINEI